ncbi:site-specific integrase [Candidatus Marinimicrobia bacterium MT.SAG.4]|nr:site-specific integrase [Candidatus Marinimicrobia bacterium MT.SAG.4]
MDTADLARSKRQYKPIRDWMIIDLALQAGLRVGEISNLEIEDLYIEKGHSHIHIRLGKGNKSRLVTIGETLRNHFKRFLKERKSKSQNLFNSERADQMTTSAIQKVVKRVMSLAGLPLHYSVHSLRHTYATLLYRSSGNNLRLVQQQLGHSSVQTTTVYANVMSEDVAKAVNGIIKES